MDFYDKNRKGALHIGKNKGRRYAKTEIFDEEIHRKHTALCAVFFIDNPDAVARRADVRVI